MKEFGWFGILGTIVGWIAFVAVLMSYLVYEHNRMLNEKDNRTQIRIETGD